MLSALQRSVCCSQRAHEEAGHEPCPGPGTTPARQGGLLQHTLKLHTAHRGQLHPLKSPGPLNSHPGMLCAPQCCPARAQPAAQLIPAMPFPELLCPLLAGKQ